MKEFASQTGGRYTYIDDIMNLQDLALAFASIFDGCGDFIISGCKVNGNSISSGYVFINGKIRYCAGTSGVSKWPIYIYENNSVEKVSYADSSDKIGRNVYGCAIGTSVPVTNDALTGQRPKSIIVQSSGKAMRLNEAFFGKYALLLNPSDDSQATNGKTVFGNDITSIGSITSQQYFQLKFGGALMKAIYDASGNLTISSQPNANNSNRYQIKVTQGGAFQFYSNDTLIGKLSKDGNVFNTVMQMSDLSVGNVRVRNGHIYDNGTMSDTGAIYINRLSYQGGTSYYRNTYIGDGKGNDVVAVNGKDKTLSIYGSVIAQVNDMTAVTLKNSNLAKTDKTLLDSIDWSDKNNEVIARIGFVNTTTFDWYIQNKIGSIVLGNDVTVTGNLIVKGTDILSSFAKKSDVTSSLSGKMDNGSAYLKSESDKRYYQVSNGLQTMITNAGGQNGFCAAIGAVVPNTLNDYVKKSERLSDMVYYGLPSATDSTYTTKLEERKKAIRDAIGAASVSDLTDKKDTGWIEMAVENCGIVTKIYVRQVGKVVSIQGQLHTHHSGTIFTLPNNIDPPAYEIGYSHNKAGNWHCIIEGGSRVCKVDYCNGGCSEYIGFLMTYLV